MFEQGPKGASAKAVKEEGAIEEVDDGVRELGKVKQYNEDKGFAFIVSMTVETDVQTLTTSKNVKVFKRNSSYRSLFFDVVS